jgi:prepilin-type N-terminal cleavage/methylation domain-containing protein
MHSKKAFSLIELSIVVLIIGILVAGITQSTSLLAKSKLSSARSQTKSSPVSSIEGIVGWWEATLTESFGNSELEESLNGGANGVTTWYDINPQSSLKNNATSINSPDSNPGYTSSSGAINGLPTLKFNGTSHYLSFDGSDLANSNYSIFIVEQRSGSGSFQLMIGGDGALNDNEILQIGYRMDDKLTWGQYHNDYDVVVPSYSGGVPRIHSLVFSSTSNPHKTYNINGVAQILDPTEGYMTIPEQGLTAYPNATFGFYGPENYYYQGNIGEIIIFNRSLEEENLQSIEDYLSRKWEIVINR